MYKLNDNELKAAEICPRLKRRTLYCELVETIASDEKAKCILFKLRKCTERNAAESGPAMASETFSFAGMNWRIESTHAKIQMKGVTI